ncbi:hypothetical protein NUW58_g6917 [Xylaria curta]|uniref:Uncharacterized protein n=1 Tax=Xylaria curta TaxID=42375 RepID=A0ACC1NMP5_9PEZI|nr:hypothetical protein NUW58_g6917 [Xylaria curta]
MCPTIVYKYACGCSESVDTGCIAETTGTRRGRIRRCPYLEPDNIRPKIPSATTQRSTDQEASEPSNKRRRFLPPEEPELDEFGDPITELRHYCHDCYEKFLESKRDAGLYPPKEEKDESRILTEISENRRAPEPIIDYFSGDEFEELMQNDGENYFPEPEPGPETEPGQETEREPEQEPEQEPEWE